MEFPVVVTNWTPYNLSVAGFGNMGCGLSSMCSPKLGINLFLSAFVIYEKERTSAM